MKNFLLLLAVTISFAQAQSFDEYLQGFSYEEPRDMKINTQEMLELVEMDSAQVIDIRFKEEVEAWSMGFAKNIPLNELPKRLAELDKNKLIITVCPHNDRANIARMFLHLKGYKTKYLSDGLVGSAEYLRGDRAKNFIIKNRDN